MMADENARHTRVAAPVEFEPFSASFVDDKAPTAWAQAYGFVCTFINVEGRELMAIGLSNAGDALGLLFACSSEDIRKMTATLIAAADDFDTPT
jgi:hypothetical protein